MNFVTYKENEIVDNNADYFLMEIETHSNDLVETIKEIEIQIGGTNVLEFQKNLNFSDLPFFCFQEENLSSIDNLNFNQLKKCQKDKTNKYMVIFLNSLENSKVIRNTKKFTEWHNKSPCVKIKLLKNDNSLYEIQGKMLKIFHKQYQPTIEN